MRRSPHPDAQHPDARAAAGAAAAAAPSGAAAGPGRGPASPSLFLSSFSRTARWQNTRTYSFFFFNLKADPLLVMITCIFPKEKKNVFSGTVSNVKEASDFLARRGLLAAGWAGVPTPWSCSGFSPLNALRPCPWRRPHAGRTGARRLKVDALSFSKGALRNLRFSTLLEKNRILRLHFRRQNSNFCTVVT